MFRVEQNVPDVYVQESRDFQLLARLYDLAFQSSRFSIDSMQDISDTMRCNATLLPLLSTKLGFPAQLDVDERAYRHVLSAFPRIIRYKGSLTGVALIANLFERITNTGVEIIKNKDSLAIIFDSYTPQDVSLFLTLLQYVRPTGFIIDYYARTSVDSSGSYLLDTSSVTVRPVVDSSTISKVVPYDSDSVGEEGSKVKYPHIGSVIIND